jgi:hypothetical protein
MFTTPLEALPSERRRNFMPSNNSANWRGYLCLWEIRDNRLFLADIEGSICTATADPTAPVQRCGGHHAEPCQVRKAMVSDFSDGADGPVFADWYTGELKVPRGNVVEYIHMGFASQYESYLMLTIAQGLFKGERVVAGTTRPQLPQRWMRRLTTLSGARIAAICVGILSASLLVLSFTVFGPSPNEVQECAKEARSGCGEAPFSTLLFLSAGLLGWCYAVKLWSKSR